jgi:hypothetical protein
MWFLQRFYEDLLCGGSHRRSSTETATLGWSTAPLHLGWVQVHLGTAPLPTLTGQLGEAHGQLGCDLARLDWQLAWPLFVLAGLRLGLTGRSWLGHYSPCSA